MEFVRKQGLGIATGAGVSLLAVLGFGVQLTETPTLDLKPVSDWEADHEPVDVFYNDRVRFSCSTCPDGSMFRIDKIELLRKKVLAELGTVGGSDKAQLLIRSLPPRHGLAPPSTPFGRWRPPSGFTPKGSDFISGKVPKSEFKKMRSTQVYAVTWTLKKADGSEQQFDPHIYAHGGKRRR